MPKRKTRPPIMPTPDEVAAQLVPNGTSPQHSTDPAPLPPKRARAAKAKTVGEAISHTAQLHQLTKRERDLALRAAARKRVTLHLTLDEYDHALSLAESLGETFHNVVRAALRRGIHALRCDPAPNPVSHSPLQHPQFQGVPPHAVHTPPPFVPPSGRPGDPPFPQTLASRNGASFAPRMHTWGPPPPSPTTVIEHTDRVYTDTTPPLPSGYSLPSPHTEEAAVASSRKPAWEEPDDRLNVGSPQPEMPASPEPTGEDA